MKIAKFFGIAALLLAAASWHAAGQGDIKTVATEKLIGDLVSADGATRVAATAEIFRRGIAELDELKKAGAKQVAPTGGTVDGTRRLDIIYSVLAGLPPDDPKAAAGYRADSFGLHLEKGTSEKDALAICKKHGWALHGKFNTEFKPSCYVQIGKGQSLAEVIRQVLTNEPKVVSINLNYIERTLK